MTTLDNQLYAVFFLPRRQKWWIEYIETHPLDTFGLKKAKVTFLENVFYPKNLKLRIPKTLTKLSPCRANCIECPSTDICSCCPATVYYKKL